MSLQKDTVLTIWNKNSRLVTRYFDKLFKEEKVPINSTQYDLLRILYIRRGRPVTITELGKEIGMDRTTLSRRLPSLIRYGYSKLTHPSSKTKAPVITKAGAALVVKYEKFYYQANKEFENTYSINDYEKAEK
ncbi:MAG TPA: hypothetical protein VGK47_09305 [Nitrososphaeraceae archaeon]